jgi:hypothetical protein
MIRYANNSWRSLVVNAARMLAFRGAIFDRESLMLQSQQCDALWVALRGVKDVAWEVGLVLARARSWAVSVIDRGVIDRPGEASRMARTSGRERQARRRS